MKFIFLFVFVICFFAFPIFRCIVLHPINVIGYGSSDLFHYFKYKQWRNIPDGAVVGKIRIFTGLFGKGKTLSMVMEVCQIYEKYHNKVVFDKKRNKYVTQRVVILSNVEMSIPYLHLSSLSEITNLVHQFYDDDIENDTLTAVICCIDEIGVNLNSRSFKTNIDAMFLNTILTCRKYHLAIYATSQRYTLVDALVRNVTQEVVCCAKKWRFMDTATYDAYELENNTNPQLVAPIGRNCTFITNRYFKMYNTYAMVSNLEKSYQENDFISQEEIMANLSNDAVGSDTVVHYSRKARKRKPVAKHR